jgi:pyruvate dehydrogenase E2 component (dihydrolipoamide acetyltransferase)
MPRIDPAMEKGIIGKIFKKEGEHVKKDELLLVNVSYNIHFKRGIIYDCHFTIKS